MPDNKDAELNQSETVLNYATAKLKEKEAEAINLDLKTTKLELLDRQREFEIRYLGDFFSNHLCLSGDINFTFSLNFCEALRKLERRSPPNSKFVIELNTPGGEVIAGLAIIDEIERIKSLGHHITTRVRGQAASMGVVILQAGDAREIGPNSFVMFHRAALGTIGKAYEVEDTIETTRLFEDQLVSILSKRSNKDTLWFKELFERRKDIWWTAQDALKEGLVDAIV